jgi:predicted nucleic acid-binding Zn ribbon protein
MDTIAQHRHCYVCGKAHSEDGRFCSDTCKEGKKAELSKKKRQLLIIEAILIAITIGAILFLA